MKINQQHGTVLTTLLLLILLVVVGIYFYTLRYSDPASPTNISISSSTANQNSTSALGFAWPPIIDQPFPDIELMSHTGEMIKLSSFKGKVILVEPIGMTCPACNAFSGAPNVGAYEGQSYQQNLAPIETLLPQYAEGISLNDPGIVLVQLILYDLSLKTPTASDARRWAQHFGLDQKQNVYVLAGDGRYINQASYDMIPGFFLIDQNFILRSDSTGHRPKYNLYSHLLPKVSELLEQPASIESSGHSSKIFVPDNNQFIEQLYASLDINMPIDKAYRSIPHRQTTFDPATASMNNQQKNYLYKLFSIVDLAVSERVQTLLWYQTKGRRGANNNSYDQILTELERLDVPKNMRQTHTLINHALTEQKQYFKQIDASKTYSFNAKDPKIQASHKRLINAYNLLMALYPQENRHNRTAFFDHLCALDFI
jgi:hypothetical protein